MNDAVTNVLLATPAAIVMVEVLHPLNVLSRLQRLQKITKRSVQVLTSQRISDHWKEFALRCYAFLIMKETGILFGQLLFALVILLGVFTLLGIAFVGSGFDFDDSILAIETQVAMLVLSIAYLALRHRLMNG